MSRTESGKEKKFIKRSHRPWNPELLEKAISDEQKVEVATIEAPPKEDIRPTEASQTINKGLIFEDPTLENRIPTEMSEEALKINLQHIESSLSERLQEKEVMLEELKQLNNSQLMIGGFFQPNSTLFETAHEHGTEVSQLMSGFKEKELAIERLQNELKIARSLEQANANKYLAKQEMVARKEAEESALSAMAQARDAKEKLNALQNQYISLENKFNQEHESRLDAEERARQAIYEQSVVREDQKNLQETIHREEDRAKHALDQTIQIEIARKKLEENQSELEKTIVSLKAQLAETQQLAANKQQEYQQSIRGEKETIIELENTQSSLREKISILDSKIASYNEQMKLTESRLAEARESEKNARDLVKTLETEKAEAIAARIAEENHRNTTLAKVEQIEERAVEAEEKLKTELNARIQAEETALEAKNERDAARVAEQEALQSIERMEEKIACIQSDLTIAKEKHEADVIAFREQIHELEEKCLASEQRAADSILQVSKFEVLIKSERDLRKIAEAKLVQATNQLKELESLRVKAEEAKDIAEEKAKKSLEKASQAFMRFLETPEGPEA